MGDLYISWTEYHQKIETLASQIYQSGWEFDAIVCIAKGGLRVGDILCRIFDKPLAIISTASYQGENNQVRGKIAISQHLSMIAENLTGNILLVDDLVDSGISLQAVQDWLTEKHGQDIIELKTAVIWYKSCSVSKPDFFVDYLKDNPWIHQPFESYEQMQPEDLKST